MIFVNDILSSNLIMLLLFIQEERCLSKKGFAIIAIFPSVRHPVIRTHFWLNPKYCSGFIFQQYVDHILT